MLVYPIPAREQFATGSRRAVVTRFRGSLSSVGCCPALEAKPQLRKSKAPPPRTALEPTKAEGAGETMGLRLVGHVVGSLN